MNHHPFLAERLAADRRRALLEAAEAHRSVRAAEGPKPRRAWFAGLQRITTWAPVPRGLNPAH